MNYAELAPLLDVPQNAQKEMLRSLKTGLIAFGCVVVYYVMFQTCYNMQTYHTLCPNETVEEMVCDVSRNFLGVFSIALLNYLIVLWLPSRSSTAVKIVRDVALSYTAMSVYNVCATLLGATIDWFGTIFNNTILLLGFETVYYVIHFRAEVSRSESRRRRELEYRYQAMKAHINPHFLFNSLNILYSLIDTKPEQAQKFTIALSNLYRYILSNQEKPEVALRSEFEFLSLYLDVLRLKYPRELTVRIDGLEAAEGHTIVPFTLQLLIENVTKHNVISSISPMEVSITVGPDKTTVSNPIHLKATRAKSEQGLRLLKQLYGNYGKEFGTTNDGHTFTATIPYLA